MSNANPRISPPANNFRRLLHSFRFRLTLLFVGILAFVLVGFSVFIYTRQAQILYAETVNRLAVQSAQLAAYYSAQLYSDDEKSEEHAMPITQTDLPLLPENTVLALIGLDGNIAFQQGSLQPDVLATLVKTWNETPKTLEPLAFSAPIQANSGSAGSQSYLFEVSPLQVERGWAGYILLASPVDSSGQLPRLAVSLALSSVLILLLAFGGGYWLADRAMKPVQKIVHTARRISESDLSQRINLHRDDEIGELANTFDQMLDRLQAAFQRQRQFTADASHELRSPLAIIELETNRALERTRSPQEYKKALRLIQSENEWMSQLVNELLLMARMDAGQTAMQTERLDLSEVVVDVTERLNPLAQAQGVALKTGLLEECYVQADRVYVGQLLTNLVENAIKYSQENDAQVLVESSKKVVDEHSWNLVRITDNGPGIPEEHLPYIFNRFYRLDKARFRQVNEEDTPISGSGLGLAIAQSIAQAYGGRIEAHSEIGKGTTFTVWLPTL
jgi:two-component system OmpR family sensor kinase